jgi:DNA-binding PadR family transcriptional regulator
VTREDLTPTSCAVLGLLALGPRSAYELTQQIATSAISEVWPRSRSSLYREPKRLVRKGYATVSRERHLGPERSVYAITEAGRAALRTWLRSPSKLGEVEEEALLKICFADLADRDALAVRIAEIRDFAARRPERAGLPEILDRGLSRPDRAHISLLVLRFMSEMQQAMRRWADWAEHISETLPDDLTGISEDQQARFVEAYETLGRQMLEPEVQDAAGSTTTDTRR